MPWWLWLSLGMVLLVTETRMTRDFTLFCVGASAILIGFMTALGLLQVWAQWLGFSVISASTLVWARDWLRVRALASGRHDHEFSNVLGEVAVPLDDLPAYGFGKAELRGTSWSAHNAAGVVILRGQRCRVMRVKGLTLWILPE